MNRFSLSGLCRKFSAFAAAVVLGGVCTSTFGAQADSSLNQLFRMDVPSKSAQGEGYVGGQYAYLKYEEAKIHDLRAFAQYGVTPDIVLQAAIPWRKAKADEGDGSESGIADIRIGAQYNLRQMIDPSLFMTAVQLVVALPTSDDDEGLDKGEFQIEPSFVAHKSYGEMGPGVLGWYGQIGANFSSAAHHIIVGLAPTYTIANDWTLISEFFLQCGKLNKFSSSSDLEWIPGVAYRGLRGFEFAVGVPIEPAMIPRWPGCAGVAPLRTTIRSRSAWRSLNA